MDRKLEIIQCARELIEERGLAKTSVAAIAERMNVARTLFYHYFPSKEDLVAAVLDTYVDEFIASLKEWNAQRVEGDIEGALDTIVALIRDQLFDNDNAHKPFRRRSPHTKTPRSICDSSIASPMRRRPTSSKPPWPILDACIKCASTTYTKRSTCSYWASSATCDSIPKQATTC